jgi:hypothetical protein
VYKLFINFNKAYDSVKRELEYSYSRNIHETVQTDSTVFQSNVKSAVVNISYPRRSKTSGCFLPTSFKLCFRICRYEGPARPDGTEIEWGTSAVGLC